MFLTESTGILENFVLTFFNGGELGIGGPPPPKGTGFENWRFDRPIPDTTQGLSNEAGHDALFNIT